MPKNRDFVVPINILTPFAHTPFSWAAQHTTMCLDIQLTYYIIGAVDCFIKDFGILSRLFFHYYVIVVTHCVECIRAQLKNSP